jgi:putative membrane protein
LNFLGHVVRFIVSALVLMFVGFIVPQFEVGGFWSALFLALVIAVLGWIIESIFGRRVSPFGRGVVGFITSAIVIWLAQFIVDDVNVTLLGALLAALAIGIIDLFIPIGHTFNNTGGRQQGNNS